MPDFDDKLLEAYQTHGIGVGDIFEDCAFHPVLCLGADYQQNDLWGISLIDGTYPRSCSFILRRTEAHSGRGMEHQVEGSI
jgi:hypothetical protein